MYDPVKLQFYLDELKEIIEQKKAIDRELTKVLKDKERVEAKIRAILDILKADIGKSRVVEELEGANLLTELKEYLGLKSTEEQPAQRRVILRRKSTKEEDNGEPVEPLKRDTRIRLLTGKYKGAIARITSVQVGTTPGDITYFVYVRKPDGTLARTSVKHSSFHRSWEVFQEENL